MLFQRDGVKHQAIDKQKTQKNLRSSASLTLGLVRPDIDILASIEVVTASFNKVVSN